MELTEGGIIILETPKDAVDALDMRGKPKEESDKSKEEK